MCFTKGRGVAQDFAAAFKWFKASAEAGNVTAQRNLADSYEHGEGVPRDVSAALSWYRRAADGGNVDALADWERLSKSAATTK